MKNIFSMPKSVKITGRTSGITNAFVNGIIPSIYPSDEEIREALTILGMNEKHVCCAYCGGALIEWDHLRPLVRGKRPTGYISEIANLVPACGKCNQSKGNKHWRDWMLSDAKLSPKSRNIAHLPEKIKRLEAYEQWKTVEPIDFEALVGTEIWQQHWENCVQLHAKMVECQVYSNKVKRLIELNYVRKE